MNYENISKSFPRTEAQPQQVEIIDASGNTVQAKQVVVFVAWDCGYLITIPNEMLAFSDENEIDQFIERAVALEQAAIDLYYSPGKPSLGCPWDELSIDSKDIYRKVERSDDFPTGTVRTTDLLDTPAGQRWLNNVLAA